jgi:hypothetical protein
MRSAVTPANAKGCLKGALVGGVAGHYTVHHGLLGAAPGCIIGRHEAKKRAQMEREKRRASDGARWRRASLGRSPDRSERRLVVPWV